MDRRAAAKLEMRRRRHGGGASRCTATGCTETDPRGLTGAGDAVLCAEHRAAAAGRARSELHHVAGRRNSHVVVPLLGNWHAQLSHEQMGWPPELLRNPEADPLLRAIAAVRGSRETTTVILDEVLGPLEFELSNLRDFLADAAGPDWITTYRVWKSRLGR